MINKAEIAIIGAGVAGIVAAKSLLEKGMIPVVLEKSQRMGGLWNYGKEDGSPLYFSMRTNISKQMMSFSDFPFPKDLPNFPSHTEVISYIKKYVQQHELEKLIVFGSEVLNVEFSQDLFSVTVKRDEIIEVLTFKKLIVASGRFDVPNIPQINGIDSFTGSVIHSKQYDIPERYKDKNVLIIGSATSAMDIGAELSEVAKKVSISFRNLPWVIPTVINGKPVDHALSWVKARIPKKIRETGFKKILLNEYIKRGAPNHMELWPFEAPPVDLEKTRFVPQEKMISLLLSSTVNLYLGIKSIKGNEITFKSGDTIDGIDSIIWATGYKTNFPFFRGKLEVENNYIGLYKQIFHPENPDLAFVGMCNIVGAAFPLMEMQSRFISEVFKGNINLPAQAKRVEEVRKNKERCDRSGIDPMRVQALSYLDHIASIIGVSPDFFANKKVLKELIFGPLIPFRYRLNGSGSNTKEATINIKENNIIQ